MAKLSSGTLEAIRNFGKEGMLTGSGQEMAPITPAHTFGGGFGDGFKKMLSGLTGGDFRNSKQKLYDLSVEKGEPINLPRNESL